jgi:hypothetical protein
VAGVVIHTGAVEEYDTIDTVPRSEWHSLLLAWRRFVRTRLPADCRLLLRISEQAQTVYEHLGFASVEDLIRRGLEIDPEFVRWATEGLQTFDPKEPAPFHAAIDAGKQRAQQLAASDEVVALGPAAPAKGGPTPNATGRRGKNKHDKVMPVPALGNSAEYLVRRLKRDAPEVAARLACGEFPSARAAARAAGILHEPTALERAIKAYRRLSPEERTTFRRELESLDDGRQGAFSAVKAD